MSGRSPEIGPGYLGQGVVENQEVTWRGTEQDEVGVSRGTTRYLCGPYDGGAP